MIELILILIIVEVVVFILSITKINAKIKETKDLNTLIESYNICPKISAFRYELKQLNLQYLKTMKETEKEIQKQKILKLFDSLLLLVPVLSFLLKKKSK